MDSHANEEDAEFKDAIDDEGFADAQGADDDADGPRTYVDQDGFTVELPKRWHFDNSFVYESEDLRAIFHDADPGNTALTKEMYQYQPLENFLKFGNSQPLRLLYEPIKESGPWEFTPEEIDAIRKFKEHCQAKGRNVPESDNEILRQLYGKKFDIPKTLAEIDHIHEIFAKYFPLKVTKATFDLLNNGLTYICGRDRLYRPVVVTRPAVYNEMPDPKPSNEEVLSAFIMFHFYLRKHVLLDGRVENVVQLYDLSGSYKPPFSMVKFMLGIAPKINRGRARNFYALNAPSAVKFVWATVRYFVDENTQNKVSFSSSNTIPILNQLIAPDQFEEKFGGTAKNREPGEFWPPFLPSQDFGEKDIDLSCLSVDMTADQQMKMSVISQSQNPMTEEQAEQQYYLQQEQQQ